MDLRVKKTLKNIYNAFIQLRKKKEIEQISVKELAELAEINKATFYLHFKDIYDLSDTMENEMIESCMQSIPSDINLFSLEGIKYMSSIFSSQSELFYIVFSGSRAHFAAIKLDKYIRKHLYEIHPELENNLSANVKLTALNYGGYYAFSIYGKDGSEDVLNSLSEIINIDGQKYSF
ncbi:MAG: TetR/AcrR family transcriptional regulator [Roseburia sp.]|nr:TetR/AcrR family transcriptional regulator [Roseburia sp.]